jgi:hypothetical protein
MPNENQTSDITNKEKSRTEEESNRCTGAAIGGAVLGGSLAGPVGVIVGGFLGWLLGDKVNESKRKERNG